MLMTLLPSSSAKSRPRRLHHRHSSFKSTIPPLTSLNSYISYAAKKLAKIILHSSIVTVTVLTLQLLYVIYRTPRLPPPPLSGEDFPREGRRIAASPPDQMIADDEDLIKGETPSSTSTTTSTTTTSLSTITKRKEFRLVLIGDSPVEGVGNATHNDALSGQTAKAFAQKVLLGGGGGMQQQKQASDHYDYDCVRYWSYGKSGLTARGIEEKMIPYLHRVVDDIISTDDTSSEEVPQNSSTIIHAIVLLCGVNNVLDVNSTASSFYLDVKSLIRSIRNNPRLMNTPLIVLGLPDFSTLPFLPWPLAFALGIRGRMMQRMLEKAIREIRLDEQERDDTVKENKGIATTTLKVIPDVQTVLESIGYHCHRSCEESDKSATIQMRFCHPLLKYLGGVQLTQDRIASLGMIDFLCDDGFHPGKLGTVYVGNLIREAYEEMMT